MPCMSYCLESMASPARPGKTLTTLYFMVLIKFIAAHYYINLGLDNLLIYLASNQLLVAKLFM